MGKKPKNIDEETLIKISQEEKLPLYIIKYICHSPFDFLKNEVMYKEKLETFHFSKLGKWAVAPGKKKRILDYMETPEGLANPYMIERKKKWEKLKI